MRKAFEILASKKIDFLKGGVIYKTLIFPVSNAGIIKCITDFWCSELEYSVDNTEKNRLQNLEIQKLFDTINKELGLKNFPIKKDIEEMKAWIKEKGYLFRC